mgnify:CR=1 FL=1
MRIAIVEDEAEQREQLRSYILQYAGETSRSFDVVTFFNALELLEDYTPQYDIILLDIEMPGLNGMEAAERLRLVDGDVVLMFVTNMAQYAINGYAVGALDFVLKPVTYGQLALKLKKAMTIVASREQSAGWTPSRSTMWRSRTGCSTTTPSWGSSCSGAPCRAPKRSWPAITLSGATTGIW